MENQAKLNAAYDKQERKKIGVVNHHDHWEMVSEILYKWVSNPDLKKSGRVAFTKIFVSVSKMYMQIVDNEDQNNHINLNYLMDIQIKMEKENKKIRHELSRANIDNRKLLLEIEALKKTNEINERHLRRQWEFKKED